MRDQAPNENPGDLFVERQKEIPQQAFPLSYRMRPSRLNDVVGQKHILGPGKLLTRVIEADRLSSLILYGPPGVGKTTLAACISHTTECPFVRINAVTSNVEELRKILAAGQHRWRSSGRKTVLFIDEIHRFNKSQQEVLLPDLEEGLVVLIGATVFNPYFSLVGPLISRSLIFELKALSEQEIEVILKRALADKEKGLGSLRVKATEDALTFLAKMSDGDARKALNALEIGVLTTPPEDSGEVFFSGDVARESIQKKVVYDRDGDAHYDTASAFIKSMRGSDPDATLYWLAKMIFAGEDHRFIARRICICAAEDVGNADPHALIVASAAMQVSEFIGMPEARIPLAQAAVYVACAPKSNASYMGLENALEDIKTYKTQEVPAHLRDASYPGAKKLGRGEGYQYAHNYDNHYVEQAYVHLKKQYYFPTEMGVEKKIKDWLARLEKTKEQGKS
ncbi:MAG: replication-associated recombination protein A [Candidatus Omnitrophota bacterium]|jgi:putative ATPase